MSWRRSIPGRSRCSSRSRRPVSAGRGPARDARIDLDRYQKLYARDAIPKQTLDTQVALVHQDEGVLKNDRGLIDNAKLQLVYSRITSPISGRVGLRLVDPGTSCTPRITGAC